MSKYDFELDMENENSLSILINMVRKKSKVLEFGPANGRMTRYLKEKLECIVDIVEIDPVAGSQAAEYSRYYSLGSEEGDIEKFYWTQKFKENKYDFIIFADVLEHLHDPKEVLIQAKGLLNEHGVILLSVPNIAHNAILLNLLENNFPYKSIGLLDNTHIHFFAYNDLKKMIKDCGYYCVEEKATYCKPENTEFHKLYDGVEIETKRQLCTKKYGNVYQFILKIADCKNNMYQTSKKVTCVDRDMDYQLSCYLKKDINSEFSESVCEKQFYRPGKNKFMFDFSKYATIAQLRIDPMECNCIIKNFKVYEYQSNKDLEIVGMNGIKNDIKYIFKTNDPMIIVEPPSTKEVIIEFEVVEFESSNIETLYDKEVWKIKNAEKEKKLLEDNCKAKEIIKKNDRKIEKLEKNLNIKECQNEELKNELNAKKYQNENLKNELNIKECQNEELKIQLNNILNSSCWKLTKPLRIVVISLKKIKRVLTGIKI